MAAIEKCKQKIRNNFAGSIFIYKPCILLLTKSKQLLYKKNLSTDIWVYLTYVEHIFMKWHDCRLNIKTLSHYL